MNQPITKSTLSNSEQRLIELLQKVNFGRIEHLQVHGGEPVWEPEPHVVQTRRMGAPRGPRDEASLQDFWLKQPVVDLIETIREIANGEIITITVMHGLPHVVELRQHVQA